MVYNNKDNNIIGIKISVGLIIKIIIALHLFLDNNVITLLCHMGERFILAALSVLSLSPKQHIFIIVS